MEDNPYSAIINTMKNAANEVLPAGYRIGTVISGIPLMVDIGGAQQDRSALVFMVTSQPVTAITETAEGHVHTVNISVGQPKYERGDKLLLIPIEDEQRYIILSKLVGL